MPLRRISVHTSLERMLKRRSSPLLVSIHFSFSGGRLVSRKASAVVDKEYTFRSLRNCISFWRAALTSSGGRAPPCTSS